jgi:hypothetical protein
VSDPLDPVLSVAQDAAGGVHIHIKVPAQWIRLHATAQDALVHVLDIVRDELSKQA